MDKDPIINKSPHTFYTHINSVYTGLYSADSQKGIVLLNRIAYLFYKDIDNITPLSKLMQNFSIKHPQLTKNDISKLYRNLHSTKLIFINNEKLKQISENKASFISVWLHMTNQCNFRCLYCYVEKSPHTMSRIILEQSIRLFIARAKRGGQKKVVFKFAGGEPLLEKKMIIYACDYAILEGKKLNIDIEFELMTNGSLLVKDDIAWITKYHIAPIISLDGLNTYNNKTRTFSNGKGTFHEIWKGIALLKKNNVPFVCAVTITSLNIKHIPTLVRYFVKNKIIFGLDLFRTNPSAHRVKKASNSDILRSFRQIYAHVEKNKLETFNQYLDLIDVTSPHTAYCRAGSTHFAVTQDGHVSPCQMTLHTPIGNVSTPINLKSTPLSLNVNKRNNCLKCHWKYLCCGGCPVEAYYSRGSYAASSSYCFIYKKLIPTLIRLKAKLLLRLYKSHD